MALETTQAIRLARTLRELRESAWPGVELTQAQLAKALSADSRVASATLSSWESLTNPKTPTASRLTGYARFFATRRSLEGKSRTSSPRRTSPPTSCERFRELEVGAAGPAARRHRRTHRAPSPSTKARSRSSARRRPRRSAGGSPTRRTPTSTGSNGWPTSTPSWRSGATSAPRTPTSGPVSACRPRSSPTTCPATSSCSAASGGTASPAASRPRSARCRSPRSRRPS